MTVTRTLETYLDSMPTHSYMNHLHVFDGLRARRCAMSSTFDRVAEFCDGWMTIL
jgi:hypothetical protein